MSLDIIKKYVGNDYQIKQSSGNTIIYVGKEFALKHFTYEPSSELEVLKYFKFSDYIIKNVDIPEKNYILYERVVMAKEIKFTSLIFFSLLVNITHALFHLHSNNYRHDDVGITNIGYSLSRSCFVVLDLEEVKQLDAQNKSEIMYNNVQNFIDDMLIYFKADTDKVNFLEKINKRLQKFRHDSGMRKKIFRREHIIYTYTYQPNSLAEILLSLLNDYKN